MGDAVDGLGRRLRRIGGFGNGVLLSQFHRLCPQLDNSGENLAVQTRRLFDVQVVDAAVAAHVYIGQ